MKKLIYGINKEDVEDAKIFNDLYHYSKGKIILSSETHKLHTFKEVSASQNNNGKKSSKKKK